MSSSDELHLEKTKTDDKTNERRSYTKWKLLELRNNKKSQEWPKVLNKKFIGVDGKWDPVGAFESKKVPLRSQSRDERPYYYYEDSAKRYGSYSSSHSYVFSNSKSKYKYDDGNVYESSRKRISPNEYYPSYYQTKQRSVMDKDMNGYVFMDNKPEWFTGGPRNINETIELSGMSRELEVGILKNRSRSTRRNEDLFAMYSDTEESYNGFKDEDPDKIDSHLMTIIKNNAKEKDKRKPPTSAKEVEKVLKSILLRPQEEVKETNNSLPPHSNGVVRTVNEIEANLKLKGNRGAGDMSAYYKLLGLVQNKYEHNYGDTKFSNEQFINHGEISTNNNHPRQLINSKHHLANIKNTKRYIKMADELEINGFDTKTKDIIPNDPNVDDANDTSKEIKNELDINCTMDIQIKHEENEIELMKPIGYNNLNGINSERLNMNSRGVCNPLPGQFTNAMFSSGQNAYRWIRAMNNAAAASARITQINQPDNTSDWDQKVDMKSDDSPALPSDLELSLESYGAMENYRNNLETSANSSYINYMNTGNSSVFNQMPVKPFLAYNFAQNSMFGRQFVNPYIMQQLYLQRQWENRNFSVQNQIRQFQAMFFNCNSSPQSTPSITPTSSANGFNPTPSLPMNQGDCSVISVNK